MEREEIDPAGVVVAFRGLDLIVCVGLSVMVFQKMRVNQRYGSAMIVVIMRVEQGRGNQRDKHGDHTETCGKTLHEADSLAPSEAKSIGGSPGRIAH